MSKMFTRIGKEIAIAVRDGGPDPGSNPRLRAAITSAKGANMPKDRVDAAIKRATSKDQEDYHEIVYEGYGPHGVPIVVECATDNPTRTVANVRLQFVRAGGTLGTTGSLDFLFDRKGIFHIKIGDRDPAELELELIDLGAEDIEIEEGIATVQTSFTDYAGVQKELEEKGYELETAELQRIPTTTKELQGEEEEEVLNLIEKLEEDDDVQNVFHNLR